MPYEYLLLKDKPVPIAVCPDCQAPFVPAMRGCVQSWWRRWLRRPYCALICEECREIVGHEKP